VPGKSDEPTKFEQYYKFGEAVKTIPSHRFLAIRRGEAEGVLRAHVAVDAAKVAAGIERLAKLDPASPWAEQLRLAVADAFKRLLAPSVENDVRAELKLRSDGAAVEIFAGNLRNLLLAALPAAAQIGTIPACAPFTRGDAVGNGTHGRETEAFAKEVLAAEGLKEVSASR
jgi:uncharacterized protein